MVKSQPLRVIVGAICLLLAGCASTGTTDMPPTIDVPSNNSPSPAPMENQATPQAERTAAVQRPTRTPWPTATPTLTPTPYPTADLPDVPLSPDGPWLVFQASTEEAGPSYLWAINHDGTGLTKLVDEPVLAFDAQPIESLDDGVIIAYVTQSEPDAADLTLKTITLPGGEIETISALIDQTRAADILDVYTLSVAVRWGGMSWSSDGSRLAYVSALDGPSIDVYIYDISSKAATRLSASPEQAYWLAWSPDGRCVIHEVFPFLEMGGPLSSGLWAACADGSGAVPLLVGDTFKGHVRYSWLSSTELLIANHCYGGCEGEILRANIETGRIRYIFRGPFDNAAYAQEYDTWLLSSWSPEHESLLVLIKNGERVEIPDQSFFRFSWSERQGVFIAETHLGERSTISLQGEIKSDPEPVGLNLEASHLTYPSPDDTLRVWIFRGSYNEVSEMWIGEPASEPRLILADNNPFVQNVIWSPDSQRLLILTYDGLLIAERPHFRPLLAAEGLYIHSSFSGPGEWVPALPTDD